MSGRERRKHGRGEGAWKGKTVGGLRRGKGERVHGRGRGYTVGREDRWK